MTITKKILLAFLIIFILIQFFRPDKNQSTLASPNDIFASFPASESTKQLVQTSCYDCHSNNTVYPWYSEIQPLAWWLADHVNEGKSELNFSEFLTYKPKKADHKLEEVIEMIQEGEMPLKSYTLIHSNARLSEAQKTEIINWAQTIRNELKPSVK
ncbi:heme-binding domain-containing protein [Daejeonella sp.]|uniref:heme-binding domain-containing protein n=1 Tax=Daejeonella sp. TaxID=2805397 RepID=UPI0025C59B0C|nr:heme-binding domain-containing protein [Daejeonella sp.]